MRLRIEGMKKQGLFSDAVFNHKLFSLALPLALQSLMLAAVAAADAIMLGRLDQNSMSAVSLATQVQFVMTMFISAITAGGSILAAQYWGKQDLHAMTDIFHIMLRLSVLIDLIFGIACVFSPGILMDFFTNDPTLKEIGCQYLRIAVWSYFLVAVSQSFQMMMKVSEHAHTAAMISTVTVFINIGLNTILIFGLLGFPVLGARGAAIATLISRIIELIWSISLSYTDGYLHPQWESLFHKNKLLSKDFARISLPVLFASLLWGVGFTSYTAIMGHLGQDAAAANSVAAVVRDLACCMCNGIAGAAGVVLGNELGQNHMDTAKDYGIRIMKISFLVGFVTTGIILAVIPAVLQFYKLSGMARQYLIGMLVITSFYMIGRCVNTIMINGIFDGGGDTKFDIHSLIVTMWCIAIPTALAGAFVFHWPILAVYACTCLDEVGKIPWVMVHFYHYKWLQNLTRAY